jgi:hypothetical protein
VTQSGWIAAALIAGFFLWLALQNRLGAYWSILSGGGAAPAAPAPLGPAGQPLTTQVPGALPGASPLLTTPGFQPGLTGYFSRLLQSFGF